MSVNEAYKNWEEVGGNKREINRSTNFTWACGFQVNDSRIGDFTISAVNWGEVKRTYREINVNWISYSKLGWGLRTEN